MKNFKTILLITTLFITIGLSAHPANKILLTFDSQEKMLTVSINHSVKNADKHYIEEITVKLNKKEIITQKLAKQDNLKQTSVIYKIIDAKIGDTISVIAKCNKFGKKTKKIVVQKANIGKNE